MKPQWEVAQHFSTAEKDFRIEGRNQTFSDEGQVGKLVTCRPFLKNKVKFSKQKGFKIRSCDILGKKNKIKIGYILTDFYSFLEISKMFPVEAKVISDVVFNIHRGNIQDNCIITRRGLRN